MRSIIDGKARRFGWALVAMVLAGCARAPLAKDPPQPQKEAELAEPTEPASPCKRAADARARVTELLSEGWLDRSRRLLDWADRSCPEEAATSRALRERVTSELTDPRSTSELIKAARAAEAAHNPVEMRRLYDRAMTRAEADAGERIALGLPFTSSRERFSTWSPDSHFLAITNGPIVSFLERGTEFGAGFVETRRIGRWGVDVAVLAFSPDSKTLAIATNDETIRWIDTTTFQEIKKLVHPRKLFPGGVADRVSAVAFSPDGRWFASRRDAGQGVSGGLEPGNIIVWNAKTGTQLFQAEDFREEVGTVAFSSDGKFVATGNGGGRPATWEVPSGRPVETAHPVVRLRMRRDHRWDEWDWLEQKGGHFKHYRYGWGFMEFSPNRAWLSLKDGQVIVDTSTGDPVGTSYDVTLDGMVRASLSPAGTHLLSTSPLGIRLWTLGAPAQVWTLWQEPGPDRATAWTADGRRFAIGLSGGTEVWTTDGRWLAYAPQPNPAHLAFSVDEKSLRITRANIRNVTNLPVPSDAPIASKDGAKPPKPVDAPRRSSFDPRVLGLDPGRLDLQSLGKAGIRLQGLSRGQAGIATTSDLGAVEVFGPDVELVGQTLRCTLGTRAFPFEFCRGRFERPGLVLDALSSEGEVSP